MKSVKILILSLLVLIPLKINSQNSLYDKCCLSNYSNSPLVINSPFDGLYKPNRTDTLYGSPLPYDASFRILIIFVQFKDDISTSSWPNDNDTSGPTYKDSLISNLKNFNNNWWDAYDSHTEPISDYWLELSRGRFHITGSVYSVVLDSNASYYASLIEWERMKIINEHIWIKLNQLYSITWPDYDNWSYNDATKKI